jgi:hypothetical protein
MDIFSFWEISFFPRSNQVQLGKNSIYHTREGYPWPSIWTRVRTYCTAGVNLTILCCALFVFFMCLVFLKSQLSVECPFLSAPSIFANVYFKPTDQLFRYIMTKTSHILWLMFVVSRLPSFDLWTVKVTFYGNKCLYSTTI